MTFSKHNWNQLSESSQNELKRLQEEAYNSGRKSVLNEQSGIGDSGWGQWADFWLWGYAGRIRSKMNQDGTVTYEFDPPHPHYGGSYTGPLGTRLYDLLNPSNFGDKPGDYNPPMPGKGDQLVANMPNSGLQGRDSQMGGMPTTTSGMGMGMGMREAWKAGFDAGRESLSEQMGMMPTSGMGDMGMGKASDAVNLSMDRTPNISGAKPNQTTPPAGSQGVGGVWIWDDRGYYYREYRGTFPDGQMYYYYNGRWWTSPPPKQ